jgi:hypothetical protein
VISSSHIKSGKNKKRKKGRAFYREGQNKRYFQSQRCDKDNTFADSSANEMTPSLPGDLSLTQASLPFIIVSLK